jgi:hypothetical protein
LLYKQQAFLHLIMSFAERDFIKKIDQEDFLPESRSVVKEYMCPLCNGVIVDPVSDPCGHCFCLDCLTISIERYRKCPLSNDPLDNTSLIQVPCLRNIIYKQLAYCKNKEQGCEWTGPYSSRADHALNQCTYEFIKCSFKDCPERRRRQEIEVHENECSYREVECVNNCGTKIALNDIEYHKDYCPKEFVLCPQNCGENIERQCEDSHLKICKNTLGECEFKSVGCEYRATKGALAQHNADSSGKHVTMMMEHFDKRMNVFENALNDLKTAKKSESSMVPSNSQPERKRPGRPKRVNVTDMDVDEEIPIRTKPPKNNENSEEYSQDDDEESSPKKRLIKGKRENAKKNYSDERYLDSNDFPSLDEIDMDTPPMKVKEKKKEHPKEIERDINGKILTVKRGRGRPPKNAPKFSIEKKPVTATTTAAQSDLFDFFSSDGDSNLNKKGRFELAPGDYTTTESFLSIDKDSVPKGINLKNDSTAVVTHSLRNQHRLVFGNMNVCDKDFSWSVKINKLGEKGWMAMGLCEKKYFTNNEHKFNKLDPHGFFVSSNCFCWNANVIKESNISVDTFPKLLTGDVVHMKYSHNSHTLSFAVDNAKLELNNVYFSDDELTPCIIFLCNMEDSASFL